MGIAEQATGCSRLGSTIVRSDFVVDQYLAIDYIVFMEEGDMSGKLFIVSLPIGNLEDISLRAMETLRMVDFISAEDTRDTRRILDRYRIDTPFTKSCYQGVEEDRIRPLLSLLMSGKNIALVSDAGTPLISDPGYRLVRAAIAAGIKIVPIPGASALIAALVSSGLPCDRFVFDGVVPRKEGKRNAYLQRIDEEERTVILYESPHRLAATLGAIAAILPERRIVVARELTKMYEEILRGKANEILPILEARHGKVKGEYVLLIEGSKGIVRRDQREAEELACLLKEEGISSDLAMQILARCSGCSRNEAYRLLHLY
ncbi:16S rRNA (cytidine(1402)-2'-O)-methyltransferase [Candidatus Bipolaricaulota bacterium]|nr:16S rRNA (cytidine(1402)-2'-O)-methyltransferase [Candidatus Bipolaricaulota bacterium]